MGSEENGILRRLNNFFWVLTKWSIGLRRQNFREAIGDVQDRIHKMFIYPSNPWMKKHLYKRPSSLTDILGHVTSSKQTVITDELSDKVICVERYRVLKKNCVFFTIHCNPSLAYIAERDLQSSQHSLQSIGW